MGVVPTPLTYFAANTLPVDGLAMITGSHNPPEYNGYKIGAGKTTFHGPEIQALRKLIEARDFETAATPGTVSAYIPGTFSNGVIRGTYEDASWQITTGTPLVVDVGASQEPVTVQAVGSGAGGAMIQFTCQNPHARGCALMIGTTILGNPGPQPGFFFRDDSRAARR